MKVQPRGESIRKYVLENVERNPRSIVGNAAAHFSITQRAISKHVKKLTAEGALIPIGNTKNRIYRLSPLLESKHSYIIGSSGAEEDLVWKRDVIPIVGRLPENIVDIWHYCFTETFNNAVNHSDGTGIIMSITKTAASTQMLLMDNGVGIFKKIQNAMNLADERQAILELRKGKLTTDPQNRKGQGIFFTARMLDSFDILSSGVYFGHLLDKERDRLMERLQYKEGTTLFLKLNNHTSRTCKRIFDRYSTLERISTQQIRVPALP